MTSLKCDYEITGAGTLTLDVRDLAECTPAAARQWLIGEAESEVVDQSNYSIRLSPRYTPEQLQEALDMAKKRRAAEGEEP